MLIIFEGVDGCGKTSLSTDFVQYLNEHFRDDQGNIKVDPHWEEFKWTREPSFSSEYADFLNSNKFKDPFKREALFFFSRLDHQEQLKVGNYVCDRYVWSGMAYAKLFSEETFKYSVALNTFEDKIEQPDLYVFVDTPIETCYKRILLSRGVDEDINKLRKIRQAYFDTMKYIKAPVLVVESEGSTPEDQKQAVENLADAFNKFMERQLPRVQV